MLGKVINCTNLRVSEATIRRRLKDLEEWFFLVVIRVCAREECLYISLFQDSDMIPQPICFFYYEYGFCDELLKNEGMC